MARSFRLIPTPPRITGRPGGRVAGQCKPRPGGAQRGHEARRPLRAQQLHRRQVQRLLQGHGGGDHAVEIAVEIMRRVAAGAHRRVLHHRVGHDQRIIERQPVEERFQRRAGRAQGAHHVHIAAGIADIGQHGAAAVIHYQRGELLPWPAARAKRG